MIKIENVEIAGWEPAIRVLHSFNNPEEKEEKSDSGTKYYFDECERKVIYRYTLGPNDKKLMMNLSYDRADYHEFTQMITVYLDVTAPSYWWKDFDACRGVCAVTNHYSMMHKIVGQEFTLDDFSSKSLINEYINYYNPSTVNQKIIGCLNECRKKYLETKNMKYWWQIIQLLPNSYNQKRTIMLSYETLANIYKGRHNHKLDEWQEFCKWVESLPYSELITGIKF